MIDYSYDVIEPKYIDFNITKVQKNGQILYINMLKDHIDLYAHFAVHFETTKNNFATEFIDKTISICKLTTDIRYEPFIRLIFQVLKEYSPEYIDKCPIKKVFV